VKRAVLLLALLTVAALWLGAGRAAATNECNGFPACVSIPGPWVPLAARTGSHAVWDLKCPDRFIVGGLDALVSDRAVDVGFLGMVGGPVAPGLTTGQDAALVGTYTGAARRRTAFKPFIGCIPTSGGGGRETTASHANAKVFPVGRPALRRAGVVRLRPGLEGGVKPTCAPKERLVSVDAAAGFYTTLPPPAAAAAAVRVAVSGLTVRISVGSGLPPGMRAEVQVLALCAGG
jgi:hypothetical protein